MDTYLRLSKNLKNEGMMVSVAFESRACYLVLISVGPKRGRELPVN